MPPKRKRVGGNRLLAVAKKAKTAGFKRFTQLLRQELYQLNFTATDLLPLILAYCAQLQLDVLYTRTLSVKIPRLAWAMKLGTGNELCISTLDPRLDVFDYSNGKHIRSYVGDSYPAGDGAYYFDFICGSNQSMIFQTSSRCFTHDAGIDIKLPHEIVLGDQRMDMNHRHNIIYSVCKLDPALLCVKLNPDENEFTKLPLPPLFVDDDEHVGEITMDQLNQRILVMKYSYIRSAEYQIVHLDHTGCKADKITHIERTTPSSFCYPRLAGNQILALDKISDPPKLLCFEVNATDNRVKLDTVAASIDLGPHVDDPMIQVNYDGNELVMLYTSNVGASTYHVRVYE